MFVCLFVLKHKLRLNNKGMALWRAEHLQLTFHSAGAINTKQLWKARVVTVPLDGIYPNGIDRQLNLSKGLPFPFQFTVFT